MNLQQIIKKNLKGFNRGSNSLDTPIDSSPDGCCNGDCNQGRNCPRRKEKKMTTSSKIVQWICAVGLAFTVGLIIGEQLLQRSIVDDCRILGATRFGEVYVKCATAQRL